jgi:hypothetical protein
VEVVMGFFNECTYILRKSNKDMILVKPENGLIYNYIKNSETCTISEKLTNLNIDFSNYHFDIDSNDNVYGIFIDNNINILRLNGNGSRFSILHRINYDYKNFNITFPYIKCVDNHIHIIYYLTHRELPTTILFHHYNDGFNWIENKIDFINLPILDNFIVSFTNNVPTIFYFKEYNEFPQVYSSIFSLNSLSWNSPIKITSSNKNKIYLSVLEDKLNFYHIAYCENHENKYCIKYINGYLNNSCFEEILNKYITTPSIYLFPSIVKSKSDIFISYVYENILYTCSSNDLGSTWSNFVEDEYSINDKFIRAYLKSNYSDDLSYKSSCLFITKNPFGILGNYDK